MKYKNEPILLEKTGETLYLSSITDADLEDVDKLAQTVLFMIGLETWRIYFQTNHEDWFLLRNSKQELIAYFNGNVMPNGIFFGFQTVVREDYRGMGVGYLFPKFRKPGIGNTSKDALRRDFYGSAFYCHKILHFNGAIKLKTVAENAPIVNPNIKISPLSQAEIPELIEYDHQMTLQNRKIFLQMWCLGPNSVACLVAKIDGKLVGFGVLRKFSFYFGLSPLYAETDEIAEILFFELLKKGPSIKWVHFPSIARNRKVLEMATKIGMQIFSTELRNGISDTDAAKKYHQQLPIQKCYGCLEYWTL